MAAEDRNSTGAGSEAANLARKQARAAERLARQAANQAEREARRAARQAEREARKPGPALEAPALPAATPAAARDFNILLIGQGGRLGIETVLFAASLRRNAPGWSGRLIVAEPRAEGAWAGRRVAMPEPVRAALTGFGAEILPFTATRFGHSYPYGNKIEALAILPAGQPFVFFDSDTLVTGPLDRVDFDFARPSASMRRSGTWPEPPPYGPGYTQIWKSLYDRFGLDFDSSLDPAQPDEHWERYLYFNAGWFFGADPQEFGRRFLDWAVAIQDQPGEALACQSLDPWLDQVTLPLVIHSLGGGRPGPELDGLDGWATCHYRNLSLLYARESDAVVALVEALTADPRIAPLLIEDEAVARLIASGEGRSRIRPMFAGETPPSTERATRQRLRRAGLWFR
ncbi:hypothetical protein [Paracoccus sp. TOH]|uniref:hypothetical protein n=1 Tax=Paracoccus sp. TOH TaxID=1263728 RepID=UPI0025AF9670|nr:hypothetical protein [Paracoccus sp. TOH]WJS84014.1 hypothetical protein NBE95_09605 [Paracoccus sp. TOH]